MSDSALEIVRLQSPTADPREKRLWGRQPLLGAQATGYRGRVVSEVWSDGFVCLAADDRSLLTEALDSLRSAAMITVAPGVLPEDSSMMTGRTTQDGAAVPFIGRVIIEFFSSGASVATAGRDGAFAAQATESRLQELA